MFITPSFKKSLIVEQFQGNYLNYRRVQPVFCMSEVDTPMENKGFVEWTYENVRDKIEW